MAEPKYRVTSIRLDPGQAEEVEVISRIEGSTSSEFIREAVAVALKSRRADPEFRRRVEARLKADRAILEQFCALGYSKEQQARGRKP